MPFDALARMPAVTYLGLDWFGMATSLAAAYLLGNRSRSGFAVFMLSNLTWIAVGILADSLALVLGNVVFFSLNLRGFLRWRPRGEAEIAP